MTDSKYVTKKVDELSAGISDTVQDLLREAKPMIHNATDRVSDRVGELAHKGMEAVRRGQHEIEHVGNDISDRATHMIRNEPFKAMLIAAGVGAAAVALIGLMARSGSHAPSHQITR
jgi:ElaB/YqjD/DUF883 family membrane-anchored ribosome-binding protein